MSRPQKSSTQQKKDQPSALYRKRMMPRRTVARVLTKTRRVSISSLTSLILSSSYLCTISEIRAHPVRSGSIRTRCIPSGPIFDLDCFLHQILSLYLRLYLRILTFLWSFSLTLTESASSSVPFSSDASSVWSISVLVSRG